MAPGLIHCLSYTLGLHVSLTLALESLFRGHMSAGRSRSASDSSLESAASAGSSARVNQTVRRVDDHEYDLRSSTDGVSLMRSSSSLSRALLCTIGALQGLQDIGVADCLTYAAGLSGVLGPLLLGLVLA